jgi:hypothetical protein
MNLDGTFNGELIGYDISLNSGAVVNQSGPSTVISEPSTWAMLLLGFAGRGNCRYVVRESGPGATHGSTGVA